MTLLSIHDDQDARVLIERSEDPERIAQLLGEVGVVYERWEVRELAPGASSDEVLAAYAAEVERIRAQGYDTVDVASLAGDPDDAEFVERAAVARSKFLAEHRHGDDEVRYFIDGSGAFYLRLQRPDSRVAVHIVMCEAGDFLSVPRGTRHWFDMGTRPRFGAIRFFQDPEGWVGDFTGDPIAERFPTFDELVAAT